MYCNFDRGTDEAGKRTGSGLEAECCPLVFYNYINNIKQFFFLFSSSLFPFFQSTAGTVQ